MKAPIPKVRLYLAKHWVSVTLSDGREPNCLFSSTERGKEYQKLRGIGVAEIDPMDNREYFQDVLDALGDDALVARDPEPSGEAFYCIEARKLRDAVARGEDEAEFELYGAAGESIWVYANRLLGRAVAIWKAPSEDRKTLPLDGRFARPPGMSFDEHYERNRCRINDLQEKAKSVRNMEQCPAKYVNDLIRATEDVRGLLESKRHLKEE